MAMNFNYGYNPNMYQYQQQQQRALLKMYPVSNIMEANATFVDGLEPIFFYNRAENVIYKKQIDNTGAAPIVVYKLEQPIVTPQEPVIPNYIETLDNKIDTLQKSFDDYIKSKNEIVQVEDDRKGKK